MPPRLSVHSGMKHLLSALILALGIGFALPATNAYAWWCGPKSVVRTRTARRGLRRSRRWVLVGQNMVSSSLASGMGPRLARRSAAQLVRLAPLLTVRVQLMRGQAGRRPAEIAHPGFWRRYA